MERVSPEDVTAFWWRRAEIGGTLQKCGVVGFRGGLEILGRVSEKSPGSGLGGGPGKWMEGRDVVIWPAGRNGPGGAEFAGVGCRRAKAGGAASAASAALDESASLGPGITAAVTLILRRVDSYEERVDMACSSLRSSFRRHCAGPVVAADCGKSRLPPLRRDCDGKLLSGPVKEDWREIARSRASVAPRGMERIGCLEEGDQHGVGDPDSVVPADSEQVAGREPVEGLRRGKRGKWRALRFTGKHHRVCESPTEGRVMRGQLLGEVLLRPVLEAIWTGKVKGHSGVLR